MKQYKNLERALCDFTPDSLNNDHWSDPFHETTIDIPHELTPEPYIVFIIFVYLKRYNFFGRAEKIKWEIPVKYKNIPFLLSHRKFGFRILSPQDYGDCSSLAIELLKRIKKAVPLAEKFIEPYVKELVNKGKITIPNDYFSLHERYKYFRKNAEMIYLEMKELQMEDSKTPFGAYNERLKKGKIASNYLVAMMDAYFSMLEHVLVLIKPFLSPDILENNLAKFIGLNWGEKFKELFDISINTSYKTHYDSLLRIKEHYRNILAHGNFQKNGGSMYVHMENIGAIPMLLTKSKGTFHFSFGHIGDLAFQDICDVFDKFDNFLEEHESAKYGLKYLKTGISVAFDIDSKKEYQTAMESDASFQEFLEYKSYLHDQAANMDW